MKAEKSEIIVFFRDIIGIKDKYALEQLGNHIMRWIKREKTESIVLRIMWVSLLPGL